jgi:acetyl esterase
MLDLELSGFLEEARASGAPDLCDLPPNAARGLYRLITAAADQVPAPVDMESRHIPGPAGTLPVRIYRPQAEAKGIVLYLHGGGFALGDLESYHAVCSQLCQNAACIVVAVDYRLAPEAPFPAAVDDCYATLEWIEANAVELTGKAAPLAVAGDSAGANLAAVLALLSRDRNGPAIDFQALIYPVTAATPGQFPSYEKFGTGYTLTRRSTEHFNLLYFGPSGIAPDFRGAPLLATSLAGLPPALVQVAGYDPLHDEGVAYAERMIADGVDVSLVDYPGLAHGFINMTGRIKTAALAFDQLASALRCALGAAA